MTHCFIDQLDKTLWLCCSTRQRFCSLPHTRVRFLCHFWLFFCLHIPLWKSWCASKFWCRTRCENRSCFAEEAMEVSHLTLLKCFYKHLAGLPLLPPPLLPVLCQVIEWSLFWRDKAGTDTSSTPQPLYQVWCGSLYMCVSVTGWIRWLTHPDAHIRAFGSLE